MELAQIFMLLLIIFVIIFFTLIIFYIILVLKNKSKKENESEQKITSNDGKSKAAFSKEYTRSSVYDFMEFDEISDNMIIRKNRTQYVMVVKCKGVNYDLMSEEEKVSVESGFVQFLNTLRFPIQLYIQTTSLNLRDIIEEYKKRIKFIEKDIKKLDDQIISARENQEKVDKLAFEKRRLENVLEYGLDISDYIARMSVNRNILQQKTYLVISYFKGENEMSENLSKEEVDNLCFSELYTRTQTAIRALGASGVIGKILNSEELSELLYSAYNRDESEVMQLSKALDAEYDSLYSTGKDALKKKEEILDEAMDREALELATNSIKVAGEEINREDEVQKRALQIVDEYKDEMNEKLYNKTKDEIVKKTNKKKANKNISKKV